jgi:hypothetical protein
MASVDVTCLAKYICNMSAEVKVTDQHGFGHGITQLCDLQSKNTIFLLKIILMV